MRIAADGPDYCAVGWNYAPTLEARGGVPKQKPVVPNATTAHEALTTSH